MRLQLRQRILSPFGRDLLLGLVCLRILRAVPFEAGHGQPQEHGGLVLADMADCAVNQGRGFGRISAVAIEDRQPREVREIGRDILARCLIFRRNRDAVTIVLDVDEQWQMLRGCNS